MSNQALNFVGRLDLRDESLVLDQQQEQAFVKRLMGNKNSRLVKKLYGLKKVRNVYVPPRVTDGSSKVMSRN